MNASSPAKATDSQTLSGLFSLVTGFVVVGVVIWWMQRPPAPPPEPPPHPPFVVPVTTVAVQSGDVAESVELVGDVAAPERAGLAFERPGRLRELSVRLGDEVKAGSVLARLDDAVIEEEVRAAEAALAQARVMADLATRDATRAKELGEEVSKAGLDRAESEAKNAAARVAQMEADLALRRALLAQGTLLAPFDAQVTARPLTVGDYVAAGDLCCELLSLERREVLLEVPASIAGSVAVGARVTLTSDELPGFALDAPLVAILPSAQARARTFLGVVRVAAADDPGHRLQPGLFVRARLVLREAKGARVVPVDALLEGPEGTRLALAVPTGAQSPPQAALIAVEVVARDATSAAVVPVGDAKLEVGELVILTGKENVYPGATVLPAAPQSTTAPAPASPASASE